MNIQDLEDLKNCNELDILFKIIDSANAIKKRTEEILGGNKQAGVDVRKTLQDIKLLSDIMRDKIQIRKIKRNKEDSFLAQSIDKEKKRLKKEEIRIKNLQEKRLRKAEGQQTN